MSNSTSITMLEDVVLLDIDGVSPVWDTYSFYIDIASPGTKRIVLRFKDITRFIQNEVDSLDTIDSIIEADQAANEVDQAADNSLPTDTKTIIANIKVEEGVDDIKMEELEYDSVASLPASICVVSPCNVLTRRCGNLNPNPTNLFAPWRYSVQPFDEEDIATEVAKRKRLFDEIEEWGRKRSRL
ncbi:hypothetical protein EDB19DRAFT_1918431 [Suillus lakei]|nr:hypothetical protein EDB19DRAFT_1918431 [Suillus lakei]